jgi:hypothetical protein
MSAAEAAEFSRWLKEQADAGDSPTETPGKRRRSRQATP